MLLEWRDGEVGRSKCHRESRWIEHVTWLIAKTHGIYAIGEWRADVQLVSYRERIWRTFEDGKANDGHQGWCTYRQGQEVEFHKLEGSGKAGQKAADAYRKGCEGKQMEQGQGIATSINPLVLRQALGCETSDFQQGEKDPWR